MTELEQLRSELVSVTASAEEWRQQVLVQDRQIARLTKTKERHKLRLEHEAAQRAELQREIDRLRRVHAQVAELLGVSEPARDHTSSEQGPDAGGSKQQPAAQRAHAPEESAGVREEAASASEASLCPRT